MHGFWSSTNVFLTPVKTVAEDETDRQTDSITSYMSTFIGRWTVGIRLLSSPTVT